MFLLYILILLYIQFFQFLLKKFLYKETIKILRKNFRINLSFLKNNAENRTMLGYIEERAFILFIFDK